MNGEADLVTVYRSADADADSDAASVQAYLAANGVNAVVVDGKTAGVVPGSLEVRVASADAPQAEALVSQFDPDAPLRADPSRDLDMVPIASMMGATGEMEAIGIKSVLDAAGITSIVIGDSTLPNLEFHIRVAKTDVEKARAVLAEAEAAGPAAAAEAERESEALNPATGDQLV